VERLERVAAVESELGEADVQSMMGLSLRTGAAGDAFGGMKQLKKVRSSYGRDQVRGSSHSGGARRMGRTAAH
jgi:hypothetical protein